MNCQQHTTQQQTPRITVSCQHAQSHIWCWEIPRVDRLLASASDPGPSHASRIGRALRIADAAAFRRARLAWLSDLSSQRLPGESALPVNHLRVPAYTEQALRA